MSRRRFLGVAGAVGATAAFGGAAFSAVAAAPAQAATPRFPGHKPGQIYLGMSNSSNWAGALAATGPIGLRRTYEKWQYHTRQMRTIAEDHAAGRLPWVSFKPPGEGPPGWRDIAAGVYDAELSARGADYAALTKPVIVSFHHEPGNGSSESDAPDYAAAWVRIFDAFERAGALTRVSFAPILSDWLFQAQNGSEDPAHWLTKAVLSRINRNSFIGVDVYQNPKNILFGERLGAIIDWAGAQGYPSMMVGIGEMGSCRYFGDSPKPETWLRDNWAWCEANTARIGVVSYFNSTANSKVDHIWPLEEAGTTKLSRFKTMLASPTTCKL